MIHIVNYKLTYIYTGQTIIDADSQKEAEHQVHLMEVTKLRELSNYSEHSIVAKSDPPIDPRQLSFLEDET